jgi:hypothetical protein
MEANMTSFFTDTDPLTLHLEENLSGLNGDLADDIVLDRLIEDIREVANIKEGDSIPIVDVAALLLAMQRHMNEEAFYLLQDADAVQPVRNNRMDLRRAISIHVKRAASQQMI